MSRTRSASLVKLADSTYEGVDQFTPVVYDRRVKAKVVDVYDGDTVTINFYLNDDPDLPIVQEKVRLNGIDTCEMRGEKGNRKKLAQEATDLVDRLILDKIVEIQFHDDNDKYRRLLGDIYIDNICVNQLLLDKGLATPYFGGKKDKTFGVLPNEVL